MLFSVPGGSQTLQPAKPSLAGKPVSMRTNSRPILWTGGTLNPLLLREFLSVMSIVSSAASKDSIFQCGNDHGTLHAGLIPALRSCEAAVNQGAVSRLLSLLRCLPSSTTARTFLTVMLSASLVKVTKIFYIKGEKYWGQSDKWNSYAQKFTASSTQLLQSWNQCCQFQFTDLSRFRI